MPVDYRMIAEMPYIDINAIGNALAVRQHLQDQPMRQMKTAAELERAKIENRLLFMEEQNKIAAEKARQANVEELINMGANGPQAAAGANAIPTPPPAAANAFTGVPGPPAAAPAPEGWRPPMALPLSANGQPVDPTVGRLMSGVTPEQAAVLQPGNALTQPPPETFNGRPSAPGVVPVGGRIPYSPEAEGKLLAAQTLRAMSKEQQDRLKEKVEILKKVGDFDPDLAGQMWNNDETLVKLGGKHNVTGTGNARDVLSADGKLIGRSVRTPDGKWSFHEVKKGDNKIVGLDPADNKPVKQDVEGNLMKGDAPYTGGQLLPLTETRDQKSFDEQSAFKPIFENKLADFVAKNNRQPSAFEKNKMTVESWREVVKAKAEFTAPTILAGTVPGQPGTGITFTGRGGEGKAGTVPLPGGGMTGKEQKPLSEKAQEDLTSSFQGLDILQTLKNTVGESGRVKGLFSKAGAWLGTNEDAVKFNTSRQQMWLMAQSAVKGIPSDKDMSMVMNSVPELWEPESVNNERIKVFERIFKNAIAAKISMYKGSNTIMPPEILALAKSKGINVDSVKPWDEVTPFNLMQGVDAGSTGRTGVEKMVKKDGKWVPAPKGK